MPYRLSLAGASATRTERTALRVIEVRARTTAFHADRRVSVRLSRLFLHPAIATTAAHAYGQVVYLCSAAPGANVRFCRIPRVCLVSRCWRAAMAAGGSAWARVSARRSASRSRYRPAMCQTRSAGSAAGIRRRWRATGVPRIRARPALRGWPCGTGTWPRRSPGCRTRRLAGPARPRLDRHAGDLAGGRRRERRRIAVACAAGRFRRKREEQRGPEHRGQSSCSRRHADA